MTRSDISVTFGSVCSGIEAASVAWHPLGWRAAWLAEIERFPSAVLKHHYPNVPNLGDMTKIARAILLREVVAPDILAGGTPCQAYSVAGLREGLNDERGQLTLSYVRLFDAIDYVRGLDGLPAGIAVWENVPGVLSDKTNAFGCLLAGLAGENVELIPPGKKWANAGCVFGPVRTVAWRILDAQYIGVAQRRRRVFVIASARKDFDPAKVLFEFDGMRRDSPPSREAGQDVTGTLEASTGRSRGAGSPIPSLVAGTLDASVGGADENDAKDGRLIPLLARTLTTSNQRIDAETETFVPVITAPVTRSIERPRGDGIDPLVAVAYGIHGETTPKVGDNIMPTLRARSTGGGSMDFVAYGFSCKDNGSDATEDLAPTMRAMGHSDSHANAGGQLAVAIAFDCRQDPISNEHVFGSLGSSSPQAQAVCVTGDITHTLKADGFDASEDGTGRGQPIVPHIASLAFAQNTRDEVRLLGGDGEIVGALAAQPGMKQTTYVAPGMRVRRLTPRECERLQGFPDDYTFIPTWNGWRKMDLSETPESCRAEGLEVRQNKKTGKWRVKDVDGPRYKALGNSMAVPCMAFLGRRIHVALSGASQ